MSSIWVIGSSTVTASSTDASGSVVPIFTSSMVPASSTDASGSVVPIFTSSLVPAFTASMVPLLTPSIMTLPLPTITTTSTSTSIPASTTNMASVDMIKDFASCYSNWDTYYATAPASSLSLGEKERKRFEKKERKHIEQQRTRCVYNRCMEGAATSCLTTTTTATTTVMWNAINDPAQTSIIASKLAFLHAVPRSRAHYDTEPWEDRNASSLLPMPWEDNRILLNKTELKASDKLVGSLNWTSMLAEEFLYPARAVNCSFQAGSFRVEDDSRRLNQYLGKSKSLSDCNSAATCQRRCAALTAIKDPKKWKKPVIVTFSIIGGIFFLAGLLGLCCCFKRRRMPRSRLPRQPTVHDPVPSMSQAPARTPLQTPTQSPRVVQTPAPAPAPALASSTAPPSPTPPQETIVRKVEDAAGQPPVVEQTKSAVGAPGVVEEVVEPVPSTVPVQVVSRAPTGAI